MTETRGGSGKCLCGSITLEAEEMKQELGVCHCEWCRRWSAGPFLALDCGTKVKILGEENLGIYNSSDWAERGFCKKCGTSLFWRLKGAGQYIVSSEIFSEESLKFDHQIFIDSKPQYYEFANQSHNMTGAEVFAAFTSK